MIERSWPLPTLQHMQRLTDNCGIIQHARFWLPHYSTGYCIDDNSRALIAAYRYYRLFGDAVAHELTIRYLSFINYAQRPDGNVRNFVDYNRTFLETEGSPDSLGRTIWALGYLATAKERYLCIPAEEMQRHAIPHFQQCSEAHALAYGLLGLCALSEDTRWRDNALQWAHPPALALLAKYHDTHDSDWDWFLPELTYGNARLPEALFSAGQMLVNNEMMDIGLRTLDFLNRVCYQRGYLSVVGSMGWYPRDGVCAEFDQQPIDAGAMVEANLAAYRLTQREEYFENAVMAMDWFYGKNVQGVPLYNELSGGCHDGLHSQGANANQGAESTLAHLMAQICMYQTAPQLFVVAIPEMPVEDDYRRKW